jgi:hypothetical protein
VAYRVARRASAKRYQRREKALQDDMIATDDVFAQVTSRYEQQLLDEELSRLPAKYREPLVLRYLLGRSNNQIASELSLSPGAVQGRLKRGKNRLRLSLARRGISLPAALAAVGLWGGVLEAATTDSLVAVTVKAAVAFRSGAPPGGDLSQGPLRLAEKEIAMSTSTVAANTSGIAVALILAGVTLAMGGDALQGPVHAQDSRIAATGSMASPGATPAEGDLTTVELLVAADPSAGDESFGGGASPEPKEPSKSEVLLQLKYGSLDKKSRGPAEERILAELDAQTVLEFIDVPLIDVVDSLKDMHGIEILLDRKALDEVGIPSDCPITRELKGVSLRSALRLILRDLDLTFVVVDEVLLITTTKVADTMMETHVYGLHGDLARFESEEVAEVIRNTIRPDTWRSGDSPGKKSSSAGGASKVPQRAGVEALPGCLVITQTQRAHEEIADLLKQLELYGTCARMLQEDPTETGR